MSHRRPDRAERPDGLDAVVPDVRPQPARPRPTRPPRPGRPVAEHVVDQLQDRASCGSPARTRTRRRTSRASCRSGGPTCSAPRRKGNEYFLKHLLGTDSSLRATEAPEGQRPREVEWHDEAPEGKLDLLLTLDFRQTSTTIFSDVVLPAATWYEKHDLNTTDMHPFVHSFNPAIAPPWQTRTDWDAWQTIAEKFSELAADASRRPHGRRRRAAAARHPRRAGQPARRGPRLEARRVRAGPGRDDAEAGRGRARLRRGRRQDDRRSARCWTRSARPPRASPSTSARRSTTCAHKNGAVRGGVADGRPSLRARRPRLRGDPGAVRHHQRPPGHPGLQDPGEAHRQSGCTTSPPSTRASRSPSPTPRPRRCR